MTGVAATSIRTTYIFTTKGAKDVTKTVRSITNNLKRGNKEVIRTTKSIGRVKKSVTEIKKPMDALKFKFKGHLLSMGFFFASLDRTIGQFTRNLITNFNDMTNYATPLGSKFIELKAKMREFTMTMVNAMAPAITWVIEKIVGLINWFNNLRPGIQKLIAIILALITAFAGLLGFLAFAALGIQAISFSFKKMGISAMLAAHTTTVAFMIVMAKVLLVIAVVALLYLAWETNFLGIRDIVNFVIYGIIDLFNLLVKVVMGVMFGLAIMIEAIALGIVASLLLILKGMESAINEAIKLMDKYNVNVLGLKSVDLTSGLQARTDEIASGITTTVEAQLAAFSALDGFTDGLKDSLANVGTPVLDALDNALGGGAEEETTTAAPATPASVTNTGDNIFNFPQGTDNQTMMDMIAEAMGLESLQAGGVT